MKPDDLDPSQTYFITTDKGEKGILYCEDGLWRALGKFDGEPRLCSVEGMEPVSGMHASVTVVVARPA